MKIGLAWTCFSLCYAISPNPQSSPGDLCSQWVSFHSGLFTRSEMPNEAGSNGWTLAPRCLLWLFYGDIYIWMSPDTLGTAVVTYISVENCDFFSPSVFKIWTPRRGRTDLIQGFQGGLTDILPKLNFKCVFTTSPRSGPWACASLVWGQHLCLPVLSHFTFSSQWSEYILKSFLLERVSQVNIISRDGLKVKTTSLWNALYFECISFRTKTMQDSYDP